MTLGYDPLAGGSGAPAFFQKDDPIGKTIVGSIVEREDRQARDIEGKPLFYDDSGKPKPEVVLTIAQRSDGEQFRVFFKGALLHALKEAKRFAEADDVRAGGTIAVAFVGLGEASKPGFNPPKQWQVEYQAPAAASSTLLSNPLAADAVPASLAAMAQSTETTKALI